MRIPQFIEELVEEGIPVTLQKDGKFRIEGFYKSSGVTICQQDGKWVAFQRYDNQDTIETLEDMVALNYSWWLRSKDRFDGWAQPDSLWTPLLLRFGYIKEKAIPARTVYE
jgi:hypothetical protein